VLRTLPARVHVIRAEKKLADRSWARKPGIGEQRSAMGTRRSARALPSARADVRSSHRVTRSIPTRVATEWSASGDARSNVRATLGRPRLDRSHVRSRRPESNRPRSVWRTGLSPRHACLVVALATWFCEAPWAARLRPALPASHSLESNQDLPVFSRMPRPTRREWGYEPRRWSARQIIDDYEVVKGRTNPDS
jgi:hypothetical protein